MAAGRGARPRSRSPSSPRRTSPEVAHLTWRLPTLPILYLAYHIPAADPDNPDTAALGALEQAVFGETSPLYDELVLKQQKAVAIEADAESKRDPGLFTILARVRQVNDLDAVRSRIKAALEEAAKKPVDPARLAAIKSHLRHEFAVSLQSAQDVAEAVGTAVAVTGRPESINTLYDAYGRLAPDDLQRVAQRYFQPKNETVITLQTETKK